MPCKEQASQYAGKNAPSAQKNILVNKTYRLLKLRCSVVIRMALLMVWKLVESSAGKSTCAHE